MRASLHPARLTEDQLRAQCTTERLRRSGPGGQHRNKVETAVVLTHTPSGLKAEANERRSQAQNLAVAIHRLRVRLALELRSAFADGESASPSGLWESRRKGSQLAVNRDHADYPALLAEALDVLASADWDDRLAAERLNLSRTQLIRFLHSEPQAIRQLNQARSERGLAELK